MASKLTAARIAVPDEVELAEFVRDVGAVGDRSGVDVEQLAPLTVAGDSDAESAIDLPADTSSVTLSIGASGTYEQVMAFATGLRGLDRLVVIDLIGLTVDEESSSSVIVDLELRIFTTAELTAPSELDDQLLDGEEELDPAELIEAQP